MPTRSLSLRRTALTGLAFVVLTGPAVRAADPAPDASDPARPGTESKIETTAALPSWAAGRPRHPQFQLGAYLRRLLHLPPEEDEDAGEAFLAPSARRFAAFPGAGPLFQTDGPATRPVDDPQPEAVLTPNDGTGQRNTYGAAVSVAGTVGLVGAYQTGDGSSGSLPGVVYVFRNLNTAAGGVTQDARITTGVSDSFGYALSLSGTSALVGAPGPNPGGGSMPGAAYVVRGLDTATGTVAPNVKLTASDAVTTSGGYGYSVGYAVSLAGNLGLVGMSNPDVPGEAYVFRNLDTATGTVTENARLTYSGGANGFLFGSAVSLSGTTGLVGAPGATWYGYGSAGVAALFRNLDTATGGVTQTVVLSASDAKANARLGAAVSLSGGTALVGAPGATVNGQNRQGAAYLYLKQDTTPNSGNSENAKLVASDGAANAQFGLGVAVSGTTGLVGQGGGSVYVFANLAASTSPLNESVRLFGSVVSQVYGSSFGRSVSLDGDRFLIGDPVQNRAFSGPVSAFTTFDTGNTTYATAGISFVSRGNWAIGSSTAGNQVTLSDTDTGNVTVAGKGVYVGQNSGASNNTLLVQGSLTANTVTVGSPTAPTTGNTLTTAASSSLTTNLLTLNNSATFNNQATLTLGALSGVASARVVNTGALTVGNATGTTFAGVISGAGTLNKTGAGALTLSGANTYTGGTTISAGTLQLGVGGTTGSLSTNSAIVDNGTLAFNRSNAVVQGTDFSGAAISGTGGVLQLGSGTVTLSPVNTYTGVTHVDPGVLRAGGSSTASAGPFGVNSAVVMDNVAGATLDLNGYNVQVGSLTGGGTTGGNLTLGAGTLTVGGNNTSPAAYAGVISGTGALVKIGTGVLLLTGGNTYSGGTTVNGGAISAPNLSSLGTGTVTFANGGVQFSAGNTPDYSTRFSAAANQNLTVDTNGQSGTFSAGFNSNGGTLTKIGAGTLSLNAGSTYTGGTTVNAGTLLVNNPAASSSGTGAGAVTVSNAGTLLGGTGFVGGAVTVNSGAGVLGGNGAAASGTLTLQGALTLNPGSFIELVLGANLTHSSLARTGTGTWTFADGQAFTLVSAGTLQTGLYDNVITGLAADPGGEGSWTISGIQYQGNFVYDGLGNIDLNMTTVPEPATWLAGALLVGAAGLSRRRRLTA